jgi:uncharacterized protein YcbX
MPTLDRITLYPVKSLDGIDVDSARVLPSGGLEHDRRWRLTDMEGRAVNAKRSARFHPIRAAYDLTERLITLSFGDAADGSHAATFPLAPGPEGPCAWLSEALGERVLLEERLDGGFPDDRDAPGPTLVSTASLEEVGRWFGFDLAESRRRFRANLEISGCDAFWEDGLAIPARHLRPPPAALPADPYADLPPPEPRVFTIGTVALRATNVCRRCVVPSRDSRTGDPMPGFREAFESRRRRSMPPTADRVAGADLYRLAINTSLFTPPGAVSVGDRIAVVTAAAEA